MRIKDWKTIDGISDSREIWNSRYTKKGHWFYDIEMIGYKANMTDLNAALGLHQLARLDTFNATRQKYAAIYKENLKDAGCDFMRVLSNNKCCWHLFPLLLAEHIDRDEFIIQLKECGIGASVLWQKKGKHEKREHATFLLT